MPQIITKQLLSGSNGGQPILITAITSGSANQIHTSVSGTSSYDEIWLYASNSTTASLSCSLNWGSQIEPTNLIRVLLPAGSGRILIADGMLLNNSKTVYAYATSASLIVVDGFVNNIV